MTVAIDKSVDEARPWIDAASPAHPSLIDTQHLVPDLYNMVNVPEVVWIDEAGRIVRPNDVTFGDDRYRAITHIDSDRHKSALRAWVKGEATAFDAATVRALQRPPSASDQLARAHFGLGQWLHEQGRADAAARHFVRGGELSPHDFTIRRGTMPHRGIDPMGPEFRAMSRDWAAAGEKYYHPIES